MRVLEPVPSPEHLFDYRGEPGSSDSAPPCWLPHHQGDVFRDVPFPGWSTDQPGLAMLFMHPCTMRKGAALKPRASVIQVRCESSRKVLDGPDQWSGHFSVMPLPNLFGQGCETHVGDFMWLGTVESISLDRNSRIATLSTLGREIFQQRIIHHITRLLPSIEELREATAYVQAEIDLQADWVEAACQRSMTELPTAIEAAERQFDEFMAANNRRPRLKTAQAASVGVEVQAEIHRRFD